MKPVGPVRAQFVSSRTRHVLLGTLVMILACAADCAAKGPPAARDLVDRDGRQLTVLLLRIVTEIDGKVIAPFRNTAPMDNITFGIGGFETGLGVKEAGANFLSSETRKEGWTYLLVRPGLHYLAVREPMSSNQFAYDARWKTCPRWRVEISPGARVLYAGTLFLPGKGRPMIFGPRQMVEFDATRLEVRDESVRAAELCTQWLSSLAPLTVQMAVELKPGDTMIIETPEDARQPEAPGP